jgi:hypothetical protein
MNKYLKHDPIKLLLETSDPVIRYLTLRDLFGSAADGIDLADAHRAIMQSPYVKALIDSAVDNVLGDKINFDTYYRGTYWKFAEAVNAGLDNSHMIIRKTGEFIMDHFCMNSGGFTLHTNPPAEDACITGEIVRFLLLAGFRDDRIHRSVEWIIAHQRQDGGWLHSPGNSLLDILRMLLFRHPGNPGKTDADITRTSCIYATIACAEALSLYKHIDITVTRSISKAAEYFLTHRLFVDVSDSGVSSRLSAGRNQNFSVPGYPLLCQYDILRGLLFIADNDAFPDRRSGDAFNSIVSQQDHNGMLHFRNRSNGMLFHGRKKENDTVHEMKWVTLNMMRLLKKSGNYTCGSQ